MKNQLSLFPEGMFPSTASKEQQTNCIEELNFIIAQELKSKTVHISSHYHYKKQKKSFLEFYKERQQDKEKPAEINDYTVLFIAAIAMIGILALSLT